MLFHILSPTVSKRPKTVEIGSNCSTIFDSWLIQLSSLKIEQSNTV